MGRGGNHEYDRHKLIAAISRWRQMSAEPLLEGENFAFARFIGYPHDPNINPDRIVDTSNPEVLRLIDLINGPNGYTILKMLEIKNGQG